MSADRSAQLIATLAPEGRAAAAALVNHLRALGLPAIVTSARRTAARQAELLRAGVTTAVRSRHLEGRALDLGFAGLRTDQVPAAWWAYAGALWKAAGGRWGGDFSDPDPLHFDW